jgi:uncharacterized membrane protein YkvA (DUF1232 family)
MASPRIIVSAFTNFRRALPLMRDERVPFTLKAAAVAMGLLIISPLDIFGDIPILGLLDDAVLLTLLAMLFVTLATRTIEKNVTPEQKPTGAALRVPDR